MFACCPTSGAAQSDGNARKDLLLTDILRPGYGETATPTVRPINGWPVGPCRDAWNRLQDCGLTVSEADVIVDILSDLLSALSEGSESKDQEKLR